MSKYEVKLIDYYYDGEKSRETRTYFTIPSESDLETFVVNLCEFVDGTIRFEVRKLETVKEAE